MNYKAAYDMIVELQQLLQAEVLENAANEQQYAEHLRRLNYKTVQALAATYELQDFLANRCTEDLEEEIFRDAMQHMAAEEGARLIEENERLKNDPNFVVPEHVYQKGMEILGG